MWINFIKKAWQSTQVRIGILLMSGFLLMALLGQLYTPHDPIAQNLYNKLLPPFWMEGHHPQYLLGTDDLGRDILSRLLKGAAFSLYVGIISVFLSLTIGVPLGILAGYFGGHIDQFLSRVMDIVLSIPSLVLAIVIAAVLGPSLENAMIAIAIVNTPTYMRLMRAQTLAEKSKEYFSAALALGASHSHLMIRTLFPNCLSPLIVQATLGLSVAILEAAALSFIGLGAQAPTPEWGAMISDGKRYFYNEWWVMAFPGFCIFFTVLGFNILGDGLRDALDPRQ